MYISEDCVLAMLDEAGSGVYQRYAEDEEALLALIARWEMVLADHGYD